MTQMQQVAQPQQPQQLSPAAQQMIAALRGIQPVRPGVPAPVYTPPVANLNPNLAKLNARVQQVATGQAKPNSAAWG